MRDRLINCVLAIIRTKEKQFELFLCKFCYCLTLLADVSHNCENTDAPDALRESPVFIYLRPVTLDLVAGKAAIVYERVG